MRVLKTKNIITKNRDPEGSLLVGRKIIVHINMLTSDTNYPELSFVIKTLKHDI